jgi:hypothetical protein
MFGVKLKKYPIRENIIMTKVVFYELQPNFNNIGFYRLLRSELGYSLSTAKHALDILMEGEIVEIEIASKEVVERVLHEAKQLGAVGKKVNMIRENISPEPVYSLEKLESLLSQLLEKLLSKKLEQLAGRSLQPHP